MLGDRGEPAAPPDIQTNDEEPAELKVTREIAASSRFAEPASSTTPPQPPVSPTRPLVPSVNSPTEVAPVTAEYFRGRPPEDNTQAVEEDAASAAAKLAGAVGATSRRAAAVVKETIVPRVERVRDRSVVILEDAPDDSGLRFVIIAGVLFFLFIFLLVLSTVIR